MNPAGVFGSDINFSPAASVYPGSGGGTSAGAAAAMSPTSNVTVSDGQGGTAPAVTNTTAPRGTIWYWLGLFGLLFVLVFVARKAGSEEDFRNLKPTFYNFAAITLTAIVGITGAKVIATRFKIPGVSDIVLAV